MSGRTVSITHAINLHILSCSQNGDLHLALLLDILVASWTLKSPCLGSQNVMRSQIPISKPEPKAGRHSIWCQGSRPGDSSFCVHTKKADVCDIGKEMMLAGYSKCCNHVEMVRPLISLFLEDTSMFACVCACVSLLFLSWFFSLATLSLSSHIHTYTYIGEHKA